MIKVRILSEEERNAKLEKEAMEKFGLSVEEFTKRWRNKKFKDKQMKDAAKVASLLPLEEET